MSADERRSAAAWPVGEPTASSIPPPRARPCRGRAGRCFREPRGGHWSSLSAAERDGATRAAPGERRGSCRTASSRAHPHALSRARAPARGGPARTRTARASIAAPRSSRGCRRQHVRSPSRASRSCSPRYRFLSATSAPWPPLSPGELRDRGSGRALRPGAAGASARRRSRQPRRRRRTDFAQGADRREGAAARRAGAVGHAGGIRVRPCPGELWYAGEAAEAVLLELDARRRALVAEIASLEERAERAAAQPVEVRPSSSPRRSSSQASSRQPPGTPPDASRPCAPAPTRAAVARTRAGR